MIHIFRFEWILDGTIRLQWNLAKFAFVVSKLIIDLRWRNERYRERGAIIFHKATNVIRAFDSIFDYYFFHFDSLIDLN